MQATDTDSSIRAGQESPKNFETVRSASGLGSLKYFLSGNWLRVLFISAAVLIPCFWHRHIEAGDLASHTYNAWLVQLIKRGQAPGLWLARQWNNVLFDVTLTNLGSMIGLRAAEKIAVSLAVLLFFWGAFALISAAARRPVWFAAPALMILTYGWTFEMGFLNYYISLGFAFWGLALIWRGRGWEQALVLPLALVSWTAHPLGTALLLGAGAYLAATRLLRPRFQPYLAIAAALVLMMVRVYVTGHYPVRWSMTPAILSNGADQLYLFGVRYELPEVLLAGLILGFLMADVVERYKASDSFVPYAIPLQIYGLSLFAVWTIPSGILFPQYSSPVSLLTERFTTICAVFACCLLGVVKPKTWHLAGLSLVAAIFFGMLYQDTGKIDRMESQIERYLVTLPPGERVVSTIWTFPKSRVFIMHIVDRASIGHAFSYDNYEPSTQQFRVRANPGSPVVETDFRVTDVIQTGRYIVQPQDLPMVEIYQCDLSLTRLCARPLVAGEMNGRYGVQITTLPKSVMAP